MVKGFKPILSPLVQLRKLRALLVYSSLPIKLDERRAIQQELEKFVMGSSYDAWNWGKEGTHRLSYRSRSCIR